MRCVQASFAASLIWLALASSATAQAVPQSFNSLAPNPLADPPAVVNLVPPVGPAPIRPLPYGPFGYYDLLSGFAPAYLSAPQPTGHEIIPTGPNGYIYQPTYGPPTTGPQTMAAGAPLQSGPAVSGRPVNAPQPPLAAASVRGTATIANSDALQAAVVEFVAGRYDTARQAASTVAAGDAQFGFAQLLESQAWFAVGRFNEATESLRQALAVLPEPQWGQILNSYRSYYRATRYTQHLAALEQYVAQHAADANAHLLLGYHAAFLGYAPQAAAQFRAVLDSAPSDALARRLLERFGGSTPAANTLAPPPRPETLEPGPRQF